MAGTCTGLVPIDSSLPKDLFKLRTVHANLKPNEFLVKTSLSLRYENEHDETTKAKFLFPFSINDLKLRIVDVGMTILEPKQAPVLIETETGNQPDTEQEAIKNAGDKSMSFLNVDVDQYQCVVGEFPPDSAVQVVVKYVSELTMDQQGRATYIFPDLNIGRTEKCHVSLSLRSFVYGDGTKVTSTRDDITWKVKDKGLEINTTFDSDSTDLDIKGDVWPPFNEGTLCVDYEKDPVITDVQTKDGLLGICLTPPASAAGMAKVITDVEVFFFVDRSGSMNGSGRIEHAKETLLLFLKSLPVGCYFNIIGFGSGHEMLFKGSSQEYNADSLTKAIKHQGAITANMGGTNLYTPLQTVLNKKPKAGMSRILFVLTDGQVSSSQECLDIARKESSTTRIFTFGIGTSVSTQFIADLSKVSGGHHEFTTTNDRDMETKVMQTMQLAMTSHTYEVTWKLDLPKGLKADSSELPIRVFPGKKTTHYIKIQGKITGKSKAVVHVSAELNRDQDSMVYKQSEDVGLILPNVRKALHIINTANMADEKNKTVTAGFQFDTFTKKQAADLRKTFNIAAPFDAVISRRIGPPDVTIGYGNINTFNLPGHVAPATVFGTPAAPFASLVQTTRATPVIRAGGARRGRRVLRDNILSINNATIKRISRRGGIARMSGLIHEEIRSVLKNFMTNIIKDSILYAENSQRRTVIEEDVDKSLKHNGIKMYGIEEYAPYIFEDIKTKARRRAPRVYRRTTPFGRPDATSSNVATLLGVTRNDVQTGLSRTASTKSSASTGKKGTMSKQPTLILDQPQAGRASKNNSTLASKSSSKTPSRSTTLVRQTTPMDTTTTPVRGSRKRGGAPAVQDSSVSSSGKKTKQASVASIVDVSVGKGRVVGKGKGKAPVPKPLTSRTRSSRGGGHGGTATGTGVPDFHAMISMITMQQFDGHWSLSGELAKMFKKALADLTNAPIKNQEVWATALSITWLEQNYPEQRTEWEMIHYKALKFMDGHDLEGHSTVDLQKKAAKALA